MASLIGTIGSALGFNSLGDLAKGVIAPLGTMLYKKFIGGESDK